MVEGATLLEAQLSAALRVDAPCGGRGDCKKCGVEVRRPGEKTWTRVLACQTRIHCDLEVRTPETPDAQILTEGSRQALKYAPLVRAVKIQVPPCPRGSSISDWQRLKAALEMPGLTADLQILRNLGALLKEGRGQLWAVYSGNVLLELGLEEPRVYMAAFDIGTTTIAAYLLDGSGKSVATAAMLNPQVAFGADVISRASYALENGTGKLTQAVRSGLNALLGQLCDSESVERRQVYAISVVGNSCMHHLFLGITPCSLVLSPYTTTLDESLVLNAADCGLEVHSRAQLWMLPLIAGFVGADTVGCLVSGGWQQRHSCALLIDIGTNGELVLGSAEKRIACSTAAGPALEGAKIECGMRGSDGAIDHVWLENGEIRWHVIGDTAPMGICGSGIVDLLAVLLKSGKMDETGRLQSGTSFSLAGTDIYLTQRDIREVQLAKAAISAGILLLANKLGVGLPDIEEVYIAGAFGSFMNPESACAIGLIPSELLRKIRIIGNAAGEGAKRVLQDSKAWDTARLLAETTEFLELATMPEFQDIFVDALEFPEVIA